MKNTRKWSAYLGAGAVIFALAGCADRNKNGEPDSPATTNEVANTVDAAGNAVATTASKAATTTGTAVSNAGKAIGNAAEAVTVTPKVKTALGANAGLKGSKIDVDTKGAKNSVTLSGTVKSASQKTLAEAIAKKNAPGYTVSDQLKVAK